MRVADYDKSIELNPHFDKAYHNRGTLKKAKGDWGGALGEYNKAIELNPKFAWAYHGRGCLRYDSQEFTAALVDFRKECELDPTLDYGHFRVWLVRARLGEREPATEELQRYLDSRKTGKPDDWESQIARFLTGQLAETDFFKAAENIDKMKESKQLCQAIHYAGTIHLIEGGKAKAAEYFAKCLTTGRKDFYEYQSAAAELKLLNAGK
jgi:lipoprotein NlpI